MIPDTALQEAGAESILRWAISTYGDRFAIVTSFQREGMVLLDIAANIASGVRVITLDTGRLPSETFEIMETARKRYGVRIETVLPDAAEVESMVTRFGPNLFYESAPQRNLCCEIRKVRPLERKLGSVDAYAVGLRREQSETRQDTPKIGESKGRLKLSPLADWTTARVLAYIAEHDVPVHPLYAQGYASIGCAPCTRAVAASEDERAGRWWWEEGAAKECGLHFKPGGGVERTVDVLLRDVLEGIVRS